MERIQQLRADLGALSEQARALGNPFIIDDMAKRHELSAVEKEIVMVLLMQDAGILGSGKQTSLTGAELLGLFFRDDFAILEARKLLYPNAPLRGNCLIVMDDYAESVLRCTYRVPERTVRALLEHEEEEV